MEELVIEASGIWNGMTRRIYWSGGVTHQYWGTDKSRAKVYHGRAAAEKGLAEAKESVLNPNFTLRIEPLWLPMPSPGEIKEMLTETPARKIVAEILADLTDRRGLRQEWEAIDKFTQQEIIATWTSIVKAAI